MRTIISFSSRSIKAIQGVLDGKKFNIVASCHVDMPKNSFANMTIMEEKSELVLAALLEARDKLKKFTACEIVLDNPLCITAELQWLSASGFERVAKNAFLYRKDFDEESFVTDYMILEKPKADQPLLALFGTVKLDVISGFLSLFKQAGLSVKRVDMAMAGLLKLVTKSPTFNRKNAIINIVDGDLLSVCSFRDNGALFIARASINEKEGTDSYFDKVAREVYNHAEFKKTDRVRGGIAERGFLYIFDMNNGSDMSGYERALKANATTDDYCSIGVRAALSENMFVGEKDIDRYASLIGMLINK